MSKAVLPKTVRSKSSIGAGESSDTKASASKYRTIKITLESCENVRPFFPVADIQAKCLVGEVYIGESRPVPITDAKMIPIEFTFEFQIDSNSARDIDCLVSYPAFLMFNQIQGTLDRHLYPQLQANELIHTITPIKSFDSIISLYEALAPKTSVNELVATGPIPKKKNRLSVTKVGNVNVSKSSLVKDKTKSKRDSKTSIIKGKSSSNNSKSSTGIRRNSRTSVRQSICSSGPIIHYEPTVFGMCTVDLLPVIFGVKSTTAAMLIKPVTEYTDERMNSFKAHPMATVTLWTDDDLDMNDCAFLNFTVETIYNIPRSLMTADNEYKCCCVMPMLSGEKMPMIFSNPVMLKTTSSNIPKCWPGIQRIGSDTNTTAYRTPDDLKDINAKFDPNVTHYINSTSLRLQFVMLKRHILLSESLDDITTHVQLYRRVVLEFLMTPKIQQGTTEKHHSTCHNGRPFETFAHRKSVQRSGPYLHLMALLDISTLLYPGVRKVRLGAPLTTFSLEEASKYGGLEDSFFMPTFQHKLNKGKEGETVATEKTKDTVKVDENLKHKLPMRPDEAMDPIQVYDEEGRPCFVVVEIELTTPLIPQKNIEDLTEDLSELIKAKTHLPETLSKVVLTSCMTEDSYKEVLNAMVYDLNKKYLVYIEEKPRSPTETGELHLHSFVEFLKNTGIYESYIQSISKVVSLLISKKYQLNDPKNNKQYQKLIGDVFVYLVEQINKTLNKLICHGMEPVSDIKHVDQHFFYAKEALETDRKEMAERYLLERICNDSNNADYWYDYGVFLLQNREDDKAFECIREALSKQIDHKYSLLTLGALLNGKNQNEEAETCFLSLMDKEFSWMEGWAVLYLFYMRSDNYEGMDMAIELAKKYSELAANEQDEFMEADELVWTKAICPNTIFFRTAILLLKCRLYEWSELALSQEINAQPGLVHYLLSAICYYKKMYVHALDHIEECKKIYGPDYAVASLAGHCYLALGRKEEAKDQYYWALEFYNRPSSMHLACVQLATILDELGEDQEARKLVLVACKYNPTPYTWMLAGKFYHQQNDLLSAEECFSEGNSIDNRYAEIWGYLALVNAKLKRANEAQLCYTQAMRNKLNDEKLIADIQNEIRVLMLDIMETGDSLHVY